MANQVMTTDVAGMLAAENAFQAALEQVNTAHSDMAEQQMNLQANWSGESASLFGQALQKWLDDFSVVKTQLTIIIDKLAKNTGVYKNTDEGSQAMAASFAKGLSGVQGLGI